MDFTPAQFSREHPCTKLHLHNCFFDGKQYVDRPLVHAQAVIGKNAPRYLIDKGFVIQRLMNGVDMYCLTKDGKQWLQAGIARHLVLHPEDIKRCKYLPPGFTRQAAKTTAREGPRPIIRRKK